MPKSPEVKFLLRPSSEKGRSNIHLQFLYNKQRLFFALGEKIDPKLWNFEKQRSKKNIIIADGEYFLNDLLDKLEEITEATYKREKATNGIPSPDKIRKELKAYLERNLEGDVKFYGLVDRFISGEIKHKGKSKATNTFRNYHTVKKHLLEFQYVKKTQVTFDTINLDFFYQYVDFLENRKSKYGKALSTYYTPKDDDKVKKKRTSPVVDLRQNSVAKDITIIKVWMNEAVDLELTANMGFRHKKFTVKEETTDAVYLTEREINTLFHFEYKSNKLRQVVDLFVFGAHVGLRFHDYASIKPDNIVQIEGDYFVKLITQKTKELVIIPCHKRVLDIFERYSNSPNRLPKSISNQKFNQFLKQACKEAGLLEKGRLSTEPSKELWSCVSSHTARRSFATNLYLEGYPIQEIMKITSHKTEKSFYKYIKITKEDAAKRLNLHMKKKWGEKIAKAEEQGVAKVKSMFSPDSETVGETSIAR